MEVSGSDKEKGERKKGKQASLFPFPFLLFPSFPLSRAGVGTPTVENPAAESVCSVPFPDSSGKLPLSSRLSLFTNMEEGLPGESQTHATRTNPSSSATCASRFVCRP